MDPASSPTAVPANYLAIELGPDFDFSVTINHQVLGLLGLILFIIIIARWVLGTGIISRAYEVDQAEFGLGNAKISLRPNEVDRQIAYKIWVELSTRKIGLPIDFDNDVIVEVYDSWHTFFSVTRELIKDVPVSKFRRRDTEKIIKLSIEVLNTGIRPHLTMWQARFRRWYERTIAEADNNDLHPQDIQKQFPGYAELREDLERVNQRLIKYRESMYDLVTRL